MATTSGPIVSEVEGGRPVKAWVRGVEFEPKAKLQVENVAKLPFIHKHVAIMPDCHWGMGATVGSVIATKGAIIPAAVGVDLGCFVGETRVPLLDGTQKSLAELAGRTEPFWVYSIDASLKIVPGLARCVRTREDEALMRVTVSGGDEIVCTPDHKFMLLDGSYREAQELRFNDSLMPLYRRWESRDGYESCSSWKGTVRQTHLMVWEALHGRVPHKYVVHHCNHIHFDNRPENLELMTTSAHSAHHRAKGKKIRNADPEFQRRRREGIARHMADPVKLAKMAMVGTQNIETFMRERPDEFAAAVKDNGKRGAPYLVAFNRTPRPCSECSYVAPNPGALVWHKRRAHANQDGRAVSNHKVIAVEPLAERAGVYCLQVEEHHNFALAAGVFVHNCGMVATRTGLTASQLPDNLAALRSAIEAAVPHGRTNDGKPGDRGAWGTPPELTVGEWDVNLKAGYAKIISKHPKISRNSTIEHLGTLGTGNHFIEVCLDEEDKVWVMLHSGSRGVGGRIGMYFIEKAKEDMKRWFINVPDVDLAYLPEGTEHFDDYIEAVSWAQEFARTNRALMMQATLAAMVGSGLPVDKIAAEETAIQCHHNYVSRENHFGENVLVTRKGAVRARKSDLGIIPGSMGTKSYIVRGLGNEQSFHSCSHGAGRRMSRTEARKTFTVADHAEATKGVECRKDADVIDETPGSYKSIDAVMEAQRDLVEVVHSLRQVLCVKG